MPLGPRSLKCVSAWSAERSLREVIEKALRAHVAEDDAHHLYGDTVLIYTDAEVATIRDWLLPCLKDGESLFVVEFERWSGYGAAPDREWLLRRGH